MSESKIRTIKTEITGVSGFATKGTLPTGRTLTGTFSSVGKIVTGTGTLFTTEIAGARGWLYSTTDNELRPFFQINGNTNLVLETAFSSNQTDQAVIVCMPLYSAISAKSIHASVNANLNGRTFSVGSIENFNNDAGINPITYDAASGVSMGQIKFNLEY